MYIILCVCVRVCVCVCEVTLSSVLPPGYLFLHSASRLYRRAIYIYTCIHVHNDIIYSTSIHALYVYVHNIMNMESVMNISATKTTLHAKEFASLNK